jgi:hypothetical protein
LGGGTAEGLVSSGLQCIKKTLRLRACTGTLVTVGREAPGDVVAEWLSMSMNLPAQGPHACRNETNMRRRFNNKKDFKVVQNLNCTRETVPLI